MRKFFIVFFAVALLAWGGWKIMFPSYDWQQTLTFYITTPDGPVIASNTGRAHWQSGPQIFVDGGGGAWSYDGEALVADLGGGKYLFNLLDNNLSLARWIGEHNGSFERGMDQDTISRYIQRSRGEVWDVPFDLLPPLITFGDVSDMETASVLDPDNIGSVLGGGYFLDRVTFEITRKPTTIGQMDEFRLAWFVNPQRWSYKLPADNEFGFLHITGPNFYQGIAAFRYIEN